LAPVKKSLYLSLGLLLLALGLIVPATAAAEGIPDITLEKSAPAQALLGTKQQVQLTAKNPLGQKRGYNLTFRDVLPKGVAYVAGSAKVAPRVLENQPGIGMTTLIFENVADLSANSEYDLGYEVEPSTTFFKFTEEHEYTNKAEAFVSRKPRNKPRFNAQGEVIAESFTGNDKAEATTELTAIEIEKSEPSPEGEILRGVHQHQTVYTLKVRNNKVGPTQGVQKVGPEEKTGIVIEDWLPAGLEFLACGKVDNTTVTSTNPGSKEEYPGSGPIDPGNAPSAPKCQEPFSVETEKTTPPGGKQPEGVYTHVKFLGPESLATGQEIEIQYIAAIPIRRNTTEWPGPGGKPSATSLGQAANLDNNNGGETFDEEQLTNVAQAHGVYESVPVQDTDEMTRTAEDLAIQKSVNQPKIFDSALSIWSLRLEASEYRRVEPVTITDHLPNGLCPLGKLNYEGPLGKPITEKTAECEPSASRPMVKYLKGGPAEKVGKEEETTYHLAEEESGGPEPRTEGGWNLEFTPAQTPALGRLEPSQELLITYPTATHTFYQNEFKNNKAKPVLTGDSWTNEVETEGPDYARCYTGEGAGVKADPNCEAEGAQRIYHEEEDGIPDKDTSAASQEAGGVEIEKSVRENNGEAVPTECEGPSTEYVKGIVSPSEPKLPQYRPGDEICWRLVVKFATNLYAGTPVVSDFIPPDEKYVQGSAVEGPENTAEATFNEKAAEEEEALEWAVGKPGEETVESNLRFEWRFRTKVDTSSENEPGEITGNLMKFLYSNTAGQTFPLRDRAEVERLEPELSLEKTITEVGGKMIPKPAPGEKSTATAAGGDQVKYELDLENAGNLDAQNAEVWDELPTGVQCSAITLLEPPAGAAAKCENGIIKWSGLSVPEGELTKLTYEMKVPTDVAPGHAFVNKTGVRKYFSKTNTTPKEFEYIPAENIDKTLTKTNTGPLLDEAEVTTNTATLEKEAVTEVTQPGNGPSQASIGELVDYTVTGIIPPNSKIYGTPVIKDTLPATLALEGTPTATIDGTPLPTAEQTLVPTPNGFEVKFTGPFPGTPSSAEHKVVVKFKARVLNIAVNARNATITNNASFEFEDKEAALGITTAKGSAAISVVEPNIQITKKLAKAEQSIVSPGEVIEYISEVKNPKAEGVSTANEVVVTDTVPTGMAVVPGSTGTGVVEGGKIIWKIPTLEPGGVETLTYKLEVVKPAKAASSFKNVIAATTQSLPEGEGGTQIRKSTFKEGAYEAAKKGYASSANVTSKLIAATVSKEVSALKGTIGTELTYTLHMNLRPEVNYFTTTMVDQLPEGITFDEFLGAECLGEVGCSAGEELGVEAGPAGTQLVGWYFGDYKPGPARELVLRFKAHIDGKKSGGTKTKENDALTNKLVGVYNEKETSKPTKVPVPGSSGFNEQTNTAETTTTVFEPNVTLTKGVTAEPPLVGEIATQPGSKLTYTLVVANTGGATAHDVEVVDTNTTANLRNITPVEGAGFVKSTGPLTWLIPTVEAGKPVTLTYTAELAPSEELEPDEEVKNAAKVPSYYGLTETERKAAEKRESEKPHEGKEDVRKYVGPEAKKDLEVSLPKISVVKTPVVENAAAPDTGLAEVNKPFGWRVVVKNESAVAAAKAVNVEDLLPPNWKYVAGSTQFKAIGTAKLNKTAFDPEGATTSVLTWAGIAELPPTASVEVTFNAIPTPAAAENPTAPLNENVAVGTFEDSSGATGSAEGAYEGEDNAFAELLAPQLTIEKTPDGGETAAGSKDHYTITVENKGTAVAHEVQVKDVLSKGQEFLAPAVANPTTGFAEKPAEANTPGTGETTVVWTISEIPAAGKVTIEVPIKTLPSLNDGEEVSDLATVSSPQQVTEPSDPGSFKVHRETDLSVEKTAVQEFINAGENIEYELKVENHGPSDATGIVVTDELPANTVFKGSDPACAEAAEVVTCKFAELKVGESHVFKFTVEVKSGTTGSIVNTAKVKGDQPEPEPDVFPNESTVTTPIGGLARLAVEKIGPEKPVLLGNDFTYEIKVENKGPSDAVEATVVDPLPSQVKFLSATTSVGECDEAPGALLTCELGRMLPLAKATIVVTVEAAEVGKFVNVATFNSETSPEPKEGEAPAEIVPAADLTITKTATPETVEPDGTIAYTLHVENHGPSVAHKVKVSDPLPAGVDFVSADPGCALAGTTVTCELAELAIGASTDFHLTVHVPFALGGGSVVNTATVGAEEGDPHPEDNTSTVTTTVRPAADLAITKTMGKAEAGKPLTYTLAITNKGPSDASAVTVKDTLPAGTTFKSAAPSQGTCSAAGQVVNCQLGPLVSGGSAQVSIVVDVAPTATGSIRNTATVEGPEPDPDKSNNESTVEGTVTPLPPTPTTPTTPTTPAGTPNLKVVKTASTSTPQVGAPFYYHVEVSNMGDGEAKNVKVVDTLSGPVKVTSIVAESGKCSAEGSTITCTIPSIKAGGVVNITYTVVAEEAGTLENTASAQASNGEKAPANNHAVKSVKAKAGKAKYTLKKTAAKKVVEGGKKVGFTITLHNGFAAMVNAKVCDRLPAALTFVKAPGARYVDGEACWTKKYVAPHKTLRLHVIARAVKSFKPRKVRNVAVSSADNAGDRSASAAVRIKAALAGKPGGVTG
jgi:large repetitive protein